MCFAHVWFLSLQYCSKTGQYKMLRIVTVTIICLYIIAPVASQCSFSTKNVSTSNEKWTIPKLEICLESIKFKIEILKLKLGFQRDDLVYEVADLIASLNGNDWKRGPPENETTGEIQDLGIVEGKDHEWSESDYELRKILNLTLKATNLMEKIISHRESVIALAEKIIVLSDAQMGNFDGSILIIQKTVNQKPKELCAIFISSCIFAILSMLLLIDIYRWSKNLKCPVHGTLPGPAKALIGDAFFNGDSIKNHFFPRKEKDPQVITV